MVSIWKLEFTFYLTNFIEFSSYSVHLSGYQDTYIQK